MSNLTNISTLIFSEGKALNRVFRISGLEIPRFGSTSDALRFNNDTEAEAVLNTLPKAIRETCSLQHFVNN